jgi:tRNA A37 threonylcarbamoyladenosine biosynthesis protein TsaE
LIFIGSTIRVNGTPQDSPITFRADAVCLVEWPERVTGRLPSPDLEISLAHPDDMHTTGRYLTLDAHTEAGERCVAAMTRPTGAPPAPA